MTDDLTLEGLARRIAEIERRLDASGPALLAPTRDWRSVVGISQETEFSRSMQVEIEAHREADRLAVEAETDQ